MKSFTKKKMNIMNQSNEMYWILIFSLCIDDADLSKANTCESIHALY
jgi:hypothetical protein